MLNSEPHIPVTLLTGFLGAGKTTLLNGILTTQTDMKIAVIVNEFGEAGLDHDLIQTVDEEVILMESGCLCCSILGDLRTTLQELNRRKKSGEIAFDRIVIETTGLADPAPILHTLLVDRYLSNHFHMDGVVTVVDAATGSDTLDRQFEAVSQVAMADLLVLSKTDLVESSAQGTFETRLKSLNPTAPIIYADHGAVPQDRLWNLNGMHSQGKPDQLMTWLMPHDTAPKHNPLDNLSGLAPVAAPKAQSHVHDARIGSASIVLDDPIPTDVFDLWLDTLILLRGSDILRVKGIVHLEGIETPFVFHGVQHLFDPPVPLSDWPKDDRRSRVVVIARDMTNPELNRSLDTLRRHKALEDEDDSPVEIL